ncbi:hypothetical protein CONLIGDRAFT_676283 [Coniochaeta ligniaria NRRL 30616]|uniref:Uncharacterized protein n=1 Tax=Coniochaeta ligniaria NRRL 30616 TaxID=1408157 RepID=A0A1J7K562_9PEZI|nr:hypothetical protein CONLIGDRAFT_676283 [Coniochaeta ligniaria NRRL 30616]
MPKRKHSVSQGMGCDMNQGPSQKRRLVGEYRENPGDDMQQSIGELNQNDRKPEQETTQTARMPKRQRTVSQVMDSDMNQDPSKKPRYVGEYRENPEDDMQQSIGELSQKDMKSEPETTQSIPRYPNDDDMQQYREITQDECKAEPVDCDSAHGNSDRQVLSCDSNMGLGHATEATNNYVESTYSSITSRLDPVYITTSEGTIKLTPSPCFYTRSYYDDLSYNPKSTDYKFTTAAELLDPRSFDILGWSPEHYAGLTNTIPVPPSAYQPRAKRSSSDPIRRTCLTSNHNLAWMVGWMRKPMKVMYQLGTGLVHPDFPATWGSVALLTEEQLDSLAEFYHQTSWNEWLLLYPCPIMWRWEDNVWVKRRKMMEFIGIRKPLPPPVEVVQWLDELENEIGRRLEEEREREERQEELRLKMWLCREGRRL